MLGNAPKSVTTGIPGWETPSEEMLLIELARKYVSDNGVIVELGGETGRSAGQFLYATKGTNVKVFTVDLYPIDHHVVGDLMSAQSANIQEALPEDVIRHTQIKSISWDAAAIFNQEVDLLFIDAGHHYEEVKKDVNNWSILVKQGGVIVFHDVWKDEKSHPLHLEVKRAVDEFYEANKSDYDFHQGVDTIVYMTKKKKNIVKRAIETIDETIRHKIDNVHTLNAKEAQRVMEIIEENKPAQPKKKGRPAKQ